MIQAKPTRSRPDVHLHNVVETTTTQRNTFSMEIFIQWQWIEDTYTRRNLSKHTKYPSLPTFLGFYLLLFLVTISKNINLYREQAILSSTIQHQAISFTTIKRLVMCGGRPGGPEFRSLLRRSISCFPRSSVTSFQRQGWWGLLYLFFLLFRRMRRRFPTCFYWA